MTHPVLNPYTGLGVIPYGYRQALAQTNSYTPVGASGTDQGTNPYATALGLAQHAFPVYDPTAEYRALENTGIEAGEIIAWRCWLVDNKDYLRSIFVYCPWRPGQPVTGLVAVGAGVYAFKTKQAAEGYAEMLYGTTVIVGSVKLWGEVVEHAHGYRAENAKIVSLDIIHTESGRTPLWSTTLRQLRKRYGV